jgi:hypothetical protein
VQIGLDGCQYDKRAEGMTDFSLPRQTMEFLKPSSGDTTLEDAKVLFCIHIERLLLVVCWDGVNEEVVGRGWIGGVTVCRRLEGRGNVRVVVAPIEVLKRSQLMHYLVVH